MVDQTCRGDPGFLESGFMFKRRGVRFADFISFYLNCSMADAFFFDLC